MANLKGLVLITLYGLVVWITFKFVVLINFSPLCRRAYNVLWADPDGSWGLVTYSSTIQGIGVFSGGGQGGHGPLLFEEMQYYITCVAKVTKVTLLFTMILTLNNKTKNQQNIHCPLIRTDHVISASLLFYNIKK